jgi:hypothetical protein
MFARTVEVVGALLVVALIWFSFGSLSFYGRRFLSLTTNIVSKYSTQTISYWLHTPEAEAMVKGSPYVPVPPAPQL